MTPKKRNWTIGGAVTAAVTGVVAFLALSGPTVVPVGANLQEYINNASAGEVLELAAGGVFDCNCVMKSGVGIDGKNAAKIRTPNAAPAVDVVPGSRDISVRNVEITTINPAQLVYDIVRVGAWQTTDVAQVPVNITFDNVWVHGQPTQDTQRGIALNGINASVINSRITEIHGRGIESQGIAIWNTPGPIKITDNRIEASTENVLTGGATSELCVSRDAQGKCVQGVVVSNVEIRRNYLYKPLTWHEGDPSWAKIDWSIKNLLELKVGRNVIIDGNVLENCWADAQIGYAVLFTVRGEDGKNPWNTLENVSFTNNTIKNVAGGFQLLGNDYGGASVQSKGLRIANNVIGIGSGLGFNGRLLLVQQYDGLLFENNESNPPQTFMVLTGSDSAGVIQPSKGLIYRNNLVSHGQYGLFADGDRPYTDFAPDGVVTGNYVYNAPASGRRIAGNTYLSEKPATVPAGVGVDYVALQAAQSGVGPTPSPSVTATVTISPSPVVSPQPTAPTADGPSENNTRIPTATRIVDSDGATWTLSGIRMLRNGQDTGGYGSALLWCGSRIYGLGEDRKWWQYTNPGWGQFGPDPCAAASPSPSATPTATATPTSTPLPTATPTPKPSPSPSPLPICPSGARPGNPPRCRCRNDAPVRPNGKCP